MGLTLNPSSNQQQLLYEERQTIHDLMDNSEDHIKQLEDFSLGVNLFLYRKKLRSDRELLKLITKILKVMNQGQSPDPNCYNKNYLVGSGLPGLRDITPLLNLENVKQELKELEDLVPKVSSFAQGSRNCLDLIVYAVLRTWPNLATDEEVRRIKPLSEPTSDQRTKLIQYLVNYVLIRRDSSKPRNPRDVRQINVALENIKKAIGDPNNYIHSDLQTFVDHYDRIIGFYMSNLQRIFDDNKIPQSYPQQTEVTTQQFAVSLLP